MAANRYRWAKRSKAKFATSREAWQDIVRSCNAQFPERTVAHTGYYRRWKLGIQRYSQGATKATDMEEGKRSERNPGRDPTGRKVAYLLCPAPRFRGPLRGQIKGRRYKGQWLPLS